MSSADPRTRRQRERSDRRGEAAPEAPDPRDPRDPRDPKGAENNGQAEPEGPLGAEIFSDEQDPFEYFGDEQGRQLEEGSFEYTLHSSPSSRKGERHAPRRVATPEGRRIEDEEQDDERPLTPEEIQRETERWAPKEISDTVLDKSVKKLCRACGKDLRGHRRYKDERGYICPDCDRLERARRIACAECGKAVAPESLKPWGPISICTRCWADHESDPKMRMKRKVSSRPWEEMEKKTVLAIAAVAVVVLVILFVISMF